MLGTIASALYTSPLFTFTKFHDTARIVLPFCKMRSLGLKEAVHHHKAIKWEPVFKDRTVWLQSPCFQSPFCSNHPHLHHKECLFSGSLYPLWINSTLLAGCVGPSEINPAPCQPLLLLPSAPILHWTIGDPRLPCSFSFLFLQLYGFSPLWNSYS